MFQKSLQTLSVGDVVSAGLRIYRDRFKVYYKLALTACLWLLVPIYGWAKFATISGLLSRLAYMEVIETPETVEEAQGNVQPRMWNFFLVGLLVGLILFCCLFVGGIVFAILIAIGTSLSQVPGLIVLVILFLITLFLGFVFLYVWLYSRISLAELPIAVENKTDPSISLGKSWKLTQGFVVRLQLIFFVAFLISVPISFVIQIVTTILQLVFNLLVNAVPDLSGFLSMIFFLVFLAITLATNALFIPFWQAIKAVLYYDLLTRREGIDLSIK
jgi:hypothetical protein